MAYTTINDPSAYFKVQLWTGDGGSSKAITFDDTDTDMQPDLVWIKNRDAARDHSLTDSVRGVTKTLKAQNTEAESTNDSWGYLSAFGSDGFTVAEGSSNAYNVNTSSEKYVAWCWKESATAGFDIVAHTGTGSTHTISHSLSAKPHMIINKGRSDAHQWMVQHHSLGATLSLILEGNLAQDDSATQWNDTEPTSSVFTVGTNGQLNTSDATYITYLFTSIQGYSSFKSYKGNGNADGPFVYTGFKPAFVMIKRTDNTGAWYMYDNKRPGYNGTNGYLQADATSAEDTNVGNFDFDFLSNGFKVRGTYAGVNASGGTYVYMAWADQPFVNSEGEPANAR